MFKSWKGFSLVALAFAVLIGVGLGIRCEWFSIGRATVRSTESSSVSIDELDPAVRQVFENRCVVCHSCYNAPCQLNFTSYEGIKRGGTKELVYNAARIAPISPTRLYTDAQTEDEWKAKGFHSIASFGAPGDSKNLSDSILWQLLMQRSYVKSHVSIPAEASATCPADIAETKQFIKDRPDAGMPYGLPPLSEQEMRTIGAWLGKGAPGPKDETDIRTYLSPSELKILRDWEEFFNARDLKTRLVSRYIFEHLFLAHVHFAQIPNEFFRLVRSSQACEAGVKEIASVRPFDDPKTPDYRYCFRRLPGTSVDKSHIVYRLSPQKMARFKELFFGNDWQPTAFPSWMTTEAANPFVTFKEIPGRSRYQFLLDDAQYHVMTFIKGPVCKGNAAVNSIQEQFFVLFLDPASDPYSTSPEFAAKTAELSYMPAQNGSKVFKGPKNVAEFLQFPMISHRNKYRKFRDEFYARTKPQGYALTDIWNGEGTNNNALLTVFRHFDSAAVVKGAVGDLSKTAFVLDYVLFERLSYDLVSGFDVFGTVAHQVLSRIYMALIRMEAEELFLAFLPAEERKNLRAYWYRGLPTQLKLNVLYPHYGADRPTSVKFTRGSGEAKQEFFEQIFSERLSPRVHGRIDTLNWKAMSSVHQANYKTPPAVAEVERSLAEIAAVPAERAPFVLQMPNVSFLRVRMGGDGSQDLAYSIVRNKEMQNIAWISGESLRREPEKDSLVVGRGFLGSYPNRFFTVDAGKIGDFVRDLGAVKDKAGAASFVSKYGVRRADPNFWLTSDWFNWKSRQSNPVEGGIFDLTRYEIPASEEN